MYSTTQIFEPKQNISCATKQLLRDTNQFLYCGSCIQTNVYVAELHRVYTEAFQKMELVWRGGCGVTLHQAQYFKLNVTCVDSMINNVDVVYMIKYVITVKINTEYICCISCSVGTTSEYIYE